MTDHSTSIPAEVTSRRADVYTIGYSERLRNLMARRTASACASFLLPHLRPGMALLDCGCGPGSITLDLAEAVAPGAVIGIDREPTQIAAARELAAERGLTNVSFEVADLNDLPFANSTFDAVFSHAVLVYLRQPLNALRSIRRILKPDGLVGLADPDFGARIWSPSTHLFEQFQSLFSRVLEYNGASLYYARNQRQLLLEAGFARSESYTFSLTFGNAEATKISAASWEECARSQAFREVAIGQGWIDEASLEDMCAELRTWGDRPDAFNALLSCASLGWVAESSDR